MPPIAVDRLSWKSGVVQIGSVCRQAIDSVWSLDDFQVGLRIHFWSEFRVFEFFFSWPLSLCYIKRGIVSYWIYPYLIDLIRSLSPSAWGHRQLPNLIKFVYSYFLLFVCSCDWWLFSSVVLYCWDFNTYGNIAMYQINPIKQTTEGTIVSVNSSTPTAKIGVWTCSKNLSDLCRFKSYIYACFSRD